MRWNLANVGGGIGKFCIQQQAAAATGGSNSNIQQYLPGRRLSQSQRRLSPSRSLSQNHEIFKNQAADISELLLLLLLLLLLPLLMRRNCPTFYWMTSFFLTSLFDFDCELGAWLSEWHVKTYKHDLWNTSNTLRTAATSWSSSSSSNSSIPATSSPPVFLPQQLVDCNCQTHKLKTRPIINHRHPSRSRALHENMKIKIKPKLSTKFHLTIFLKLLFECACAIIIIERESKERISSGICSSCSTLNGCHSPQSPVFSAQFRQ